MGYFKSRNLLLLNGILKCALNTNHGASLVAVKNLAVNA